MKKIISNPYDKIKDFDKILVDIQNSIGYQLIINSQNIITLQKLNLYIESIANILKKKYILNDFELNIAMNKIINKIEKDIKENKQKQKYIDEKTNIFEKMFKHLYKEDEFNKFS